MSDTNTTAVPQREPWMTKKLEKRLRAVARDDAITCEQAQLFAQDNDIEIKKMKPLVDALGIKVKNCSALCK